MIPKKGESTDFTDYADEDPAVRTLIRTIARTTEPRIRKSGLAWLILWHSRSLHSRKKRTCEALPALEKNP
jgi:hypothetical protein